MNTRSGMGWVMGMIGGALALFAGVVGLVLSPGSELEPLAWLFVAIGVITILGNLALRTRQL